MARLQLLNVGFSNIILTNRIVAILNSDSASGKRLRDEAKKEGNLIDATQGRKTRSIVVADSGHILLSCIRTESLVKRLETNDNTFGAFEEDES